MIVAGVEHADRSLPFPASEPARALEPLVAVADDASAVEARAEPADDPSFGLETLPFTAPGAAPELLREQADAQVASTPVGPDDDPSFGLETLPFVADPDPPQGLRRQGTVLLKWPEGARPFKVPPPEATEDDFDTRTAEAPRLPRTPALPFQAAAKVAAETSDGPFGGTVELRRAADPTPTPMRSPFRLAEPGAPPPRALGDIPGAPWASSSAPAVPRPLRGRQQTIPDQPMDELTVERLRGSPRDVAPEAAPAPEPRDASEPVQPAEPAGDRGSRPDRAWSWATTAEAPRAESAPAGRPPPVPKLEVQRSIYGRFVPGKKT